MTVLRNIRSFNRNIKLKKEIKERKELEREFASLRHMEKVRGEKIGDQIILRLW